MWILRDLVASGPARLGVKRVASDDLTARREQLLATGECTHPGCFVQRVRKSMKRNELGFCAVQKSA
jgi:hypothetical protein